MVRSGSGRYGYRGFYSQEGRFPSGRLMARKEMGGRVEQRRKEYMKSPEYQKWVSEMVSAGFTIGGTTGKVVAYSEGNKTYRLIWKGDKVVGYEGGEKGQEQSVAFKEAVPINKLQEAISQSQTKQAQPRTYERYDRFGKKLDAPPTGRLETVEEQRKAFQYDYGRQTREVPMGTLGGREIEPRLVAYAGGRPTSLSKTEEAFIELEKTERKVREFEEKLTGQPIKETEKQVGEFLVPVIEEPRVVRSWDPPSWTERPLDRTQYELSQAKYKLDVRQDRAGVVEGTGLTFARAGLGVGAGGVSVLKFGTGLFTGETYKGVYETAKDPMGSLQQLGTEFQRDPIYAGAKLGTEFYLFSKAPKLVPKVKKGEVKVETPESYYATLKKIKTERLESGQILTKEKFVIQPEGLRQIPVTQERFLSGGILKPITKKGIRLKPDVGFLEPTARGTIELAPSGRAIIKGRTKIKVFKDDIFTTRKTRKLKLDVKKGKELIPKQYAEREISKGRLKDVSYAKLDRDVLGTFSPKQKKIELTEEFIKQPKHPTTLKHKESTLAHELFHFKQSGLYKKAMKPFWGTRTGEFIFQAEELLTRARTSLWKTGRGKIPGARFKTPTQINFGIKTIKKKVKKSFYKRSKLRELKLGQKRVSKFYGTAESLGMEGIAMGKRGRLMKQPEGFQVKLKTQKLRKELPTKQVEYSKIILEKEKPKPSTLLDRKQRLAHLKGIKRQKRLERYDVYMNVAKLKQISPWREMFPQITKPLARTRRGKVDFYSTKMKVERPEIIDIKPPRVELLRDKGRIINKFEDVVKKTKKVKKKKEIKTGGDQQLVYGVQQLSEPSTVGIGSIINVELEAFAKAIGKTKQAPTTIKGTEGLAFVKSPQQPYVALPTQPTTQILQQPKSVLKQEPRMESLLRPRSRLKSRSKSRLKSRLDTRIGTRLQPRTEVKLEPKLATKLKSRLKSRLKTRLKSRLKGAPLINISLLPPTLTPIIGIPLPKAKKKQKAKRKKKKGNLKLKARYTPSLIAVGEDIFTAKSRKAFTTGLELRPIIRGKK